MENESKIPKFKSRLRQPTAVKKSVHIQDQPQSSEPSVPKRLRLEPQHEQLKRTVKVALARRSVAKAQIIKTRSALKAVKTSSKTAGKIAPTKPKVLQKSTRMAPLKATKRHVNVAASQKLKPKITTSSRAIGLKPKAAAAPYIKQPSLVPNSVPSKPSPPGSTLQPPKRPKRKAWDIKGQLEDAKEDVDFFKKAVKKFESDLVRFANVAEQIEELEEQKRKQYMDFTKKEKCLQQELRQACDELEDFENKLQESEKKLNVSEKERKQRIGELAQSRKQCEDLESTVTSLQAECDANSRKLKSSNERASNLQTVNERQKEEIKIKTEEIKKKTDELYAMEEERRKLLNLVQELKGNIRVYCRVRPLLSSEKDENEDPNHIEFEEDDKSLIITEGNKCLPFQFDRVFNMASTQRQIFDDVSQLIQSALDGYNVCIFAYGQTGSGKTYTMEGTSEQMGIIPRAIELIFEKREYLAKFGWKFELSVQQVQIYMEMLMDLLPNDNSNDKLEIKTVSESNQQKIWVKNLSEHGISSFNEVIKLLEFAKKKRITASTKMNDFSSRSHSVFILKIKAHNETTDERNESALNLVDLAGSERVSAAGSTGTRMKEAQKINSSLSELCNVIAALANKKSHIPYRNSKLTFLLKDSLGGNSKTLMLVNVNPRKSSTLETINTLRFATTVNQCNIGTARKNIKF